MFEVAGATPQIRSTDTDAANDYSVFQNSSGNSVYNAVDNNSAGGHIFQANASEKVRIDSSGRLLVGATADDNSTGALIQAAATASTAAFSANRYTNTADGPARLYLFKSRATSIGGQTIVQDGDDIGEVVFHASDGTDAAQAAVIRAEVDGTPGDNDMPGRLSFHTTADGAVSSTERLRIDSSGNIGINETTPTFTEFGSNGGGLELDDVNTGFTAVKVSQGSTNLFLVSHSSGAYVSTRSNNALVFETNATAALTLSSSQNATFAGTVSDSKGDVRQIIYQNKTSGYTLVASDAGKAIHISTGGVTINNSIFSAGDAVTIINNSGSNQTITQGSGVTLYDTGDDGSTGNKTLKGRGMATVWFSSASVGYITGNFD